MPPVIKVENLSKQYRLGDVGTGTLRDDFKRWRYRLMGKEDPFLKIGEENDRRKVSESDYVWALKDINFEVEQGDVVGIIGRNGAGKSTLLKILSRTTAPTTGSVKVKGRIASLLEVGTGFHGELSGRENIYLNGAIMGLRKWEIDKKLDEIIDFAGVERYIDTPVKRYSSGMYVRLAFAVAAYLEPDILIVDEVLAVGDAEFQKKCLGKMKDVSEGQGRTVLFVSHNMGSIRALCNNALLFDKGKIKLIGSVDTVTNSYTEFDETDLKRSFTQHGDIKNKKAYFKNISILNDKDEEPINIDVFDNIFTIIEFEILKSVSSMHICINLTQNGVIIWRSFDTDLNSELLGKRQIGIYKYKVKLPYSLKAGIYVLNYYIGIINSMTIDSVEDCIGFEIQERSFNPLVKSYAKYRQGILVALPKWEFI